MTPAIWARRPSSRDSDHMLRHGSRGVSAIAVEDHRLARHRNVRRPAVDVLVLVKEDVDHRLIGAGPLTCDCSVRATWPCQPFVQVNPDCRQRASHPRFTFLSNNEYVYTEYTYSTEA